MDKQKSEQPEIKIRLLRRIKEDKYFPVGYMHYYAGKDIPDGWEEVSDEEASQFENKVL